MSADADAESNAPTGRQERVTRHFDAYAQDDRWGALYDPKNARSHSFLERRDRSVELLGDLAGAHLLDLGCGSGVLLPCVMQAGLAGYVGIDIAPTMIEQARANMTEFGLPETYRAAVGDVTALDLPDAHFDRVVAMGVLEYFDDPRDVLREAARVTKPGGIGVFTVPNRAALHNRIIRASGALRRVARKVTGGEEPAVARDEYTPETFREMVADTPWKPHDERFYNRLAIPYPVTRVAPRVASHSAKWTDLRATRGGGGLEFLATGYIASLVRSG